MSAQALYIIAHCRQIGVCFKLADVWAKGSLNKGLSRASGGDLQVWLGMTLWASSCVTSGRL